MVDRIRRGHLDVRIEGKMHGEARFTENGINAMAVSLSEYHVESNTASTKPRLICVKNPVSNEIQNVELDIAKNASRSSTC